MGGGYSWHCPQGGGQEPWLDTKAPQKSHLVLYLLPSKSCSPDRCLWGLRTLPIPLLSKSRVEGVGIAALVHRPWVSRDIRICPEPMSWPDPAGRARCRSPSWCRFTSSIKVQCLPLPPFSTPEKAQDGVRLPPELGGDRDIWQPGRGM